MLQAHDPIRPHQEEQISPSSEDRSVVEPEEVKDSDGKTSHLFAPVEDEQKVVICGGRGNPFLLHEGAVALEET